MKGVVMAGIRAPAVAGVFYPGRREELRREVRDLVEAAGPIAVVPAPKALIVPHAGYRYSGAVAASGYVALGAAGDSITRVVLLGPSHHVSFDGLALSGAEAFRTPLGDVAADREGIEAVAALPQVRVLEGAHEREHSLEVHLPFLQEQLGTFRIVPLVVGQATPEEVAEVLEVVWGGPETLLVVSSDLSHFLDEDSARAVDAETCRKIESLEYDRIAPHEACGSRAVAGLLLAASRHRLRPVTLDLRNSADTAGLRDRVVGYGAWRLAG